MYEKSCSYQPDKPCKISGSRLTVPRDSFMS
jgi:hypothetical protein